MTELHIILYETTPISTLWINGINIKFNGDIRDIKEHFPNCRIDETEGAGIYEIHM